MNLYIQDYMFDFSCSILVQLFYLGTLRGRFRHYTFWPYLKFSALSTYETFLNTHKKWINI